MNRLWHDPVWSKVIAGAIVAAAGGLGVYVLDWWPIVSRFLTGAVLLIIAIVGVVAGLVGYGIATWRAKKISVEEKELDGSAKFDEVFEPKDSVKFYAEIADFYDRRNSEELLHTHRVIVTEVKRRIDSKVDAWVLDIGGGTGKLIAHHFFDDRHVKWVYIDACGRMAEKFRENLSDVQLRTEVHVMTLAEAYDRFSPGRSNEVGRQKWTPCDVHAAARCRVNSCV